MVLMWPMIVFLRLCVVGGSDEAIAYSASASTSASTSTSTLVITTYRPEESCSSICFDGSDVKYPGNVVSINFQNNLPFDESNQYNYSHHTTLQHRHDNYSSVVRCDAMDSIIHSFDPDQCKILQQSVGIHCGCGHGYGYGCSSPIKLTTKLHQCTLCQPTQTLRNPNTELPFFAHKLFLGLVKPTCALLDAYLKNIPHDSTTCILIKHLAAQRCGCTQTPRTFNTDFPADHDHDHLHDHDHSPQQLPQQQQPHRRCSLCQMGKPLSNPQRPLPISNFTLFSTCGQLDQALRELVPSESSTSCSDLREFGTYCGCPVEQQRPKCQLTSNCSSPNQLSQTKHIPLQIFQVLNLTLHNIISPSCDVLDTYASKFLPDSEACTKIQKLSGFCGCNALDHHCDFCLGQGTVPSSYRSRLVHTAEPFLGFLPTCELVTAYQYKVEDDSHFCQAVKERGDLCGCNNAQWNYMGTSSNNQRLILSWIPRITGILSMLASVAVVVDIIRTKRLRQSNSQLVLAMTMFDMMTAISWSLSTLPIPQYDEFGYSLNIYGAKGTDTTCKIQAFFLQFGYSSIFYNVSLCVFYLLRGESKKAQPWLVGVPAVLGLTLAFAGIPFYDTMTLACHIPSLSTSILDRNMWGGIIFAVVPIFCVMFVSITLLISLAVIRHRLKQNNDPFSLGRRHRDKRPKSKKRFSSVTGGSSSMLSSFVSDSTQSIAIAMRHSSKRRMSFSFAASLAQRLANDPGDIDEQFWQCVCFVSGFFICWPIYAVGIMVKNLPYGVWILIALLAPLQGFLNCLTYFRPRVLERLDPQSSHRRRRRSFDETAVDDSTSAARLGRSNTLDSSLRSVGGSGKRMGSLEPNGRASSSLDSSGKRFSGLDSNIDGYDGDDFIEEGDGDSGLLSRIEEENSKFMEMEEEESKQMER